MVMCYRHPVVLLACLLLLGCASFAQTRCAETPSASPHIATKSEAEPEPSKSSREPPNSGTSDHDHRLSDHDHRLSDHDHRLTDEPSGDPVTTPLARAKPWIPGWCRWDWRASWLAQHKAMVDQSTRGDIDIVFLGDSLTKGWHKQLANKYAPYKAVNFGIGGDSTRQILWRVRHGLVDSPRPKLIILMIGTNNFYNDANGGTNEEIAKGIEACVNLLREKCPTSQILLLGILPRQNQFFCSRVSGVNSMIKDLGEVHNVLFLDMNPRFLGNDGRIRPDLFQADRLHLSVKGYEVWEECMESSVRRLLAVATTKKESLCQ